MPSDVVDPGRARIGAARREVLTREPVRGVPAAVPAPTSGDPAEGIAELAGKALDNLADSLGGALRSRGGPEQLEKALQDALLATAKAHGTSLVEAAPMGKTLLVAFGVSRAFADGVGEELEKVNKRLGAEYDALIRSFGDTIGPDEDAAIRKLRRWQSRSTRELGGLVEAGLRRAGSHALDLALEAAKDALTRPYEKVIDGLAKEFVARDEAFAALNGLITGAPGEIPSQRREVERQFLAFALRLWVKQLEDKQLAEQLDPLLRASSSGLTADVALLATLIDIAARGTYARVTHGTFLDDRALQEMRKELEWEAWEAARRLARRMGLGTNVKVAEDGGTHPAGSTISVPEVVYERLERGTADPSDALRRFRTRELVYDEFVIGLRARLMLVGKAHQRAIDRAPASRRWDEYLRREALLRRERTRADEQARRALNKLLAEFEGLLPPDVLDRPRRLESGWLIHLPIVSRRNTNGGLSDKPEDDR